MPSWDRRARAGRAVQVRSEITMVWPKLQSSSNLEPVALRCRGPWCGSFRRSEELRMVATARHESEVDLGPFAGRGSTRLARWLHAETQFSDVRAGGGSLSALVRAVADQLGAVTYLLAADERIVARALPEGVENAAIPRLQRLLAELGPAGPPRGATLAPLPVTADGRIHVVALVGDGDGGPHAWLVVGLERDHVAESLWIIDRAAVHLGGEYLSQQRLARVAWNARANLGRQMIRGSSYDADLRACAEYLGVDLDTD